MGDVRGVGGEISEWVNLPIFIRGFRSWQTHGTGDLLSVRMLGQVSIIINTAEAARELLGKRAQIYSDRPHLEMIRL